ncbi:MAG: class I SAM-dependent methyltransferase [Rhodobacteraceae bacterium]|nr:class I SAM-dependent methyltransferase [Paracoccaceae bacterium]
MTIFQTYYDRIYAEKDYAAEAATVLQVMREASPRLVARVLDVGCGTGSHAVQMAAAGVATVGIDIDGASIQIAKSKTTEPSTALRFVAGSLHDLPDSDFDGAVSLFNVVNYLMSTEDLIGFLAAIQQRVSKGAPFVFDCWNGLAAILDPPRTKISTVVRGEETIRAETTPEIDLMGQTVILRTKIEISVGGQIREQFDHDIAHRLWLPRDLSDCLHMAGFDVLKTTAWMKPDVAAGPETWKMLFVCRRKN